jgi:hypothetical protein
MIHRAVSVSFVSKKKNGTGPATLRARGVNPVAPLSWRVIMQVVMGHAACCPAVSATVCKAACIDKQQTVKNDVNLPFRCDAIFCGTIYVKASIQTGV